MAKVKAFLNKEDIRRALNFSADYDITDVRLLENGEVEFDLATYNNMDAKPESVTDLTEIARLIQRAMDTKKEITISYEKTIGEPQSRVVLPIKWQDSSLFLAKDLNKSKLRAFSLANIVSVTK